jgi:hypothetical protein
VTATVHRSQDRTTFGIKNVSDLIHVATFDVAAARHFRLGKVGFQGAAAITLGDADNMC